MKRILRGGSLLAAMLMLAAMPLFAQADWWPGVGGIHQSNSIFSTQSQVRARGNIHGTIVAVDYSGNTMVVAGPDGRQTITILPTTSIFRGGENASISDLAPGMRVTVSVSDMNGSLIAQIIRIH